MTTDEAAHHDQQGQGRGPGRRRPARTMAESTTTTTGSNPHEATSTISTKAQEKLPRDEMTSPAGWSMCQR